MKRAEGEGGEQNPAESKHRSHYTVSMAVYLLVNVDVQDAAAYEEYKAGVPAMIAKHGGEYLVRGGKVEVMEGDWSPKRVAVLKFATRDAALGFLNDPEYAPLKALRQRVASTQMVMVEGL